MPVTTTAPMAVFELPPETETVQPDRTEKTVYSVQAPLPESFLLRNARWFCHLRWIVVGILLAAGVLGSIPGIVRFLDIRPHWGWAFFAAGFLTAANTGYLWHIRLIQKTRMPGAIQRHLWIQIVLDLMVLTGVIHFVGSIETYASFAYLFHIVLSCIFFSASRSFAVTVIASVLYVLCVGAETSGIIPSGGIYADSSLRNLIDGNLVVLGINILSALVIWFVVWYLASHISALVREREYRLSQANERLKRTQVEKARHMLRTTHELKAPFAAIEANTQLLLKGHCGTLPDAANEVLGRIFERCRRLTREIQEMLQLANLRSTTGEPQLWRELNLEAVLEWCLSQIQPLAEERGIVIGKTIAHAAVRGIEDHLKMLFINVLSNAINYSYKNGKVTVECKHREGHGAEVIINDEGIGIPAEKLPRIFEEYYRTDEAVRHNKGSSGLGLTIVAHIARTHGIRVRVQSAEGAGTIFFLQFPFVQNYNRE